MLSRPSLIRIAALASCAGLLLAGCAFRTLAPAGAAGETAFVPAGSSASSIQSGGRTRAYRVYVPPSLDRAKPAPLVVFLHGGFGNGQQAEGSYGWDAQADAASFVVAYPDGISRAWNGGTCCGQPQKQGINDVGFIRDLVTRLETQLALDPDRIYATGISNGGITAYRLACETNLFAAIGPDSATMLVPCTSPSPTSVIAIHGTADRNIRYEGGTGDGFAQVAGPAVPEVVARWRSIDQCAAPSSSVAGVVTTSIAGCPAGRMVELITVAGAGHQWPGGKPPNPILATILGLDQPSTALDATSVIWAFMAAHPKR